MKRVIIGSVGVIYKKHIKIRVDIRDERRRIDKVIVGVEFKDQDTDCVARAKPMIVRCEMHVSPAVM